MVIVCQETLFQKHLSIIDYRQLRFMCYLVEPALLNESKREIILCSYSKLLHPFDCRNKEIQLL